MSATAPAPAQRAPAGRIRRLRARVARPPIAVAGAVLFVGLVTLAFNVRLKGFLLDETIIKQSAVHYTRGLPHNLLHDVTARATSRLYSLLISPLFAWFDGDVAVRATRGLNGTLFASAAIPAYLLARQAVVSRWLAAAAAIASIAFPWLTLTTAIFTENLAYPLVLWTVLAISWSFRSPGLWCDLLAVALVAASTCTRTQLIALGGAYVIVVAWRLWLDRPRRGEPRGRWARDAVRRFPVTFAAVAVVVLVALYLLAKGTLSERVRSFLGGYAQTTSDRTTLPSDVGSGLAVEVLALSLGVGLVPAILAVAWWPRALARRTLREYPLAVAAVVSMVVLWAATMWSQGGFIGFLTEERYYFYAAPFLWIGALAALESRSVSPRAVLEVGLALALIALLLPIPRGLDVESSFFLPAMATTSYLLGKVISGFDDVVGQAGLSNRDALALMFAALTVATWALWRWSPRRGGAIALGIAAFVQLALTLTAFYAIDGKVHGVPGRVSGSAFDQVGFIDRNAGGRPVTWIDNQIRTNEDSANTIERVFGLYNDQVEQRLDMPQLGITPDNFPLNSLPLGSMRAAPAGGRVSVAPPVPVKPDLAVESVDSPFLQLDETVIARSPETFRLQLVRLAKPLQARWRATGLKPDGTLPPGTTARLRSWGARRIVLQLVAPQRAVDARLRLAGTTRHVHLTKGSGRAVQVTVCGGRTAGSLSATGPLQLVAVRVLRAAGCS